MEAVIRKSIFAGILIGLGGFGELYLGGVVGAILFSLGIICATTLDIPFFTGRAGRLDYSYPFTKDNFKTLGKILLGNIIGCALVGILVRLEHYNAYTIDAAQTLIAGEENLTVYEVILRAIACGLIIDVCVSTKNTLLILLGVVFIVLSGCIHAIADVFYIIVAGNIYFWRLLWYIPLIFVCNFIGCNIRRIFMAEFKKA